MKRILIYLLGMVLTVVICSSAAFSQSTEFVYQGQLQNSSAAANGSFDFEFLLFDASTGGSQIGATLTKTGVNVTNGIFSAPLDFGANFPGSFRYLEIHVRQTGGGAFTPLLPRQFVSSSPYSVKSLNSDTAANALNATNATNAVNATNATTATTATNVSGVVAIANGGTGSATKSFVDLSSNQTVGGGKTFTSLLSGNLVNSATEYDIAGTRALGITGSPNFLRTNTFVGDQAGIATTPSDNPIFTGISNSFFGSFAGTSNTVGYDNSFFGRLSGNSNTSGIGNSFFGQGAGAFTSSGNGNSFFGEYTGNANTTGFGNSFFGAQAGDGHQTGDSNTFVGVNSGVYDTGGTANTLVGALSQVPSGAGVNNSTAIGANAYVSQSNSLVLGGIAGLNNAAVSTSVGIGTSAPQARFHVVGTSWFQGDTTPLSSSSGRGVAAGYSSTTNTGYLFAYDYTAGSPQTLSLNSPGGRVGIGTTSPAQTLDVSGRARIESIPVAASVGSVCFNAAGDLLQCGASSLRWKTNVQPYRSGLDVIRRLNPISFEWKDGGSNDVGLAAEDVAKIAPSLALTNREGEVEGVKYERLNLLLINAVKEQQVEIERLEKKAVEVDELKAIICGQKRRAAICKRRD